MAGRDAASLLLLGLLALLHTWGGRAAVEVSMTSEVEAVLGDTAQIPCTFKTDDGVGGSGAMIIEWSYVDTEGTSHRIYHQDSFQKTVEKKNIYTDRIRVDNNGTAGEVVLTISDVQLRDQVDFICQVRSVTEGTGEGRTKLRVFKTPDLPTIEGVKTGISVDETSKIGSCEVKNGFPKPSIIWYRNNTPLRNIKDEVDLHQSFTSESTGLFSVINTLTMKVKKEDKDATFYCEVKYKVPGAEKMTETERINVIVFYPPTAANMWVESPKGKIKEGDSVELQCSSNGNSPSQEITIKKDDPQGQSLGGPVVMLKNVSRLDSGVYTCTVNYLGDFYVEEFTSNTSLFVNYLGEAVIKPNHSIVVNQKEEVTATCNALSSLQTKTTWFKNGKEISKGHHLTLKDVTYDNTGIYDCEVTVPEIYGLKTNASLQVRIQGPPEITEKDLNEKETAEKDVELSCHVRGYPSPKITWTTPDGKVIRSASEQKTDMGAKSVVKVKVTSNMTIFCNSSNNLGSDSATYIIKPKITKHTTPPTTTTTTTVSTATITAANTTTNTGTTNNAAITKSTVKPESSKPQQNTGSNGVIIAVIIICILLLAILGSVLYFLYKKGKICNRSGKQDFTKDTSGKDKTVVEMRSDNTEEAILLGVNGEKQLPSDQ